MPAPGEALGPYTLVRALGTGGMGEVWAATGPDGVEVALKVLPEGALNDATARARFAREVAAAQRVQNPRVQAVLAADAEAPRPWLATELVAGPTLAQRVATDGPLPGPELHALATGLADALAAVHAAGVLHRDVSPANVVLGTDGPVLVDFGIARFAEATTLTMAGTVMGTAGWLAPELLRDDEVSAAADVWSLGAVLAYAATGRPPADGSRAEVVLRKVIDGDLDLRGLPPWLEAGVRRCLEPDPARRPTAAELRAALAPGGAATLPTVPQVATAVAPVEVPPTAVAPPVDLPPDVTRPKPSWVVMAMRGGVLGLGLLLGLLAPPLLVVILIALAVLVAIGLKLWAEERATEKRLPVGPVTVMGAAAVAAIAAMAQVIGLLFAVMALAGLVVVFFLVGGDLG